MQVGGPKLDHGVLKKGKKFLSSERRKCLLIEITIG